MARQYYVYILSSFRKALYIGVTGNLLARLEQHRTGTGSRFADRYRTSRLVYLEYGTSVHGAIRREKQIKGWTRSRKIALIESVNPDWREITEGWQGF